MSVNKAFGIIVDVDSLPESIKILVVLNNRGEWMLPGGGIDSGESSFNAAKRELQEESGLRLNNVRQDSHAYGLIEKVYRGSLQPPADFFIGTYPFSDAPMPKIFKSRKPGETTDWAFAVVNKKISHGKSAYIEHKNGTQIKGAQLRRGTWEGLNIGYIKMSEMQSAKSPKKKKRKSKKKKRSRRTRRLKGGSAEDKKLEMDLAMNPDAAIAAALAEGEAARAAALAARGSASSVDEDEKYALKAQAVWDRSVQVRDDIVQALKKKREDEAAARKMGGPWRSAPARKGNPKVRNPAADGSLPLVPKTWDEIKPEPRSWNSNDMTKMKSAKSPKKKKRKSKIRKKTKRKKTKKKRKSKKKKSTRRRN